MNLNCILSLPENYQLYIFLVKENSAIKRKHYVVVKWYCSTEKVVEKEGEGTRVCRVIETDCWNAYRLEEIDQQKLDQYC